MRRAKLGLMTLASVGLAANIAMSAFEACRAETAESADSADATSLAALPEPEQAKPKVPGRFPNGKNTGVRRGGELKRYDGDMTVTKDGAVISGLKIRGSLRIQARDVVVKNVEILSDGDSAILIPDPYRATVKNCDIIGGRNGISGAGTFKGNNISKVENGINVYGPSVIEDNYIHDMAGGPDAHFDGIENNGSSDMVLRGNTIINDHGQTAAVMLNNEFGALKNVLIENNFLAGGGYTIYSARLDASSPIENVKIKKNWLGKGEWGYFAFTRSEPLLNDNRKLGANWKRDLSLAE